MNAHNTTEVTGTCKKKTVPTAIVVTDEDSGVETSTSARNVGGPGSRPLENRAARGFTESDPFIGDGGL